MDLDDAVGWFRFSVGIVNLLVVGVEFKLCLAAAKTGLPWLLMLLFVCFHLSVLWIL